jgi:hypothetical protein
LRPLEVNCFGSRQLVVLSLKCRPASTEFERSQDLVRARMYMTVGYDHHPASEHDEIGK